MPALGSTLAEAVARVRIEAPHAPVALLVPSEVSGVLAAQALAGHGPWIGVTAWTPEAVVRSLGAAALTWEGRTEDGGPEAVVRGVLAETTLPERFAFLSARPWRPALADALARLEGAGVPPAQLSGLPPPWEEHGSLLAWLLISARAWRDRHRRYSLADCATASPDPGSPPARATGVVILGDVALSPQVAASLRRWLHTRPVVRVAVPPLGPVAPDGLWALRPDAPTLEVPEAPGALGALQAGRAAPLDASVRLCRVPDDAREATELARLALTAARSGTPLDRIAIAPADRTQIDALRDALRAAGLPAVLLAGPPLAGEGTGRFLRLALDLLGGDTALATLYAWARHPLLAHKRRLGQRAAGKGRWRRLLKDAGPWSGVSRVATALDAPGPAEDEPARTHLVALLRALADDLGAARGRRPLGVHAAGWADFLQRWCRPVGPDFASVREALLGNRADPTVVDESEAADEIRQLLAATPMREGKLQEQAIRVLEPGALRGADLDVVLVGGLMASRIPRQTAEDPLLPEGLRTLLPEPRPLPAPGPDEDRRRFADAISAARVRIDLVVPEATRDPARPAHPSPLVLDVLTTLDGAPAPWRRWTEASVRLARAHEPVPSDPQQALTAFEHRLALCFADPPAGVAMLEASREGRGPLDLLRRLAAGDTTPTVPPGTVPLPGDGGAPMPASTAATLLDDAARFLFRAGLRAFPAPRLPSGAYSDERNVHRTVREAAEATAAAGTIDAACEAWEAGLTRLGAPDVAEVEDRAEARRQATDLIRRLGAEGRLPFGPEIETHGEQPFAGLEIAIGGPLGRLRGDALTVLTDRDPKWGLPAGALQAAAAGAPRVAVDPVDGKSKEADVGALLQEMHAAAEASVRNRAEGRWPWGEEQAFRLEEEAP